MDRNRQSHMERRVLHAAALRGMGQDLDGEIPASVWPFAKIYVITLAVLLFCIPGTALFLFSSFSIFFGRHIPGEALFATILSGFFGVVWTGIGCGLCWVAWTRRSLTRGR